MNISKNLNSNISNIIHFAAFYPDSNINTLKEDLLTNLNNIIIDNYSVGGNLDQLLNYICNDEQIEVNGNTYDLVSVAFLRVNNDNGRPVENNSTHYISAKKQSNGKWVLIDSKFPGKTESFDNFKQLVEKYVKKCCDYQLDDGKAARRFMPRLLCFTKSDNEFSIFNPDNYLSDNQEHYN